MKRNILEEQDSEREEKKKAFREKHTRMLLGETSLQFRRKGVNAQQYLELCQWGQTTKEGELL